MNKILITITALVLSATAAMASDNYGDSSNANYSGTVGAGSYAAGGSFVGNVGNGKAFQTTGSGAWQNSGLSFNTGPEYLSIGTITEGGDYAWVAGKTKNAFGAAGAFGVRGGWSVGTGTLESDNEWDGQDDW